MINLKPGICRSCLKERIISSEGLCIDCFASDFNGPREGLYRFHNIFYIPERMMGGIERYVKKGILPGDFLRSIIKNDLKQAVMFADDENMQNLPAFVSFFYNETPAICWGSEEKMNDWVKRGGMPDWEPITKFKKS